MKILIIGIVASGKTTLARNLSSKLNINHYEIDSIVHDDINNRKRSEKEQLDIFNTINTNKDWILEGTLRKNLYFIMQFADKIIYIDIPLRIRKIRIFKRFIKQKIGIEKCNYKVSLKMLRMMYKWTYDFEKSKSIFESNLFNYSEKLIILKSDDDFINISIDLV